MTANDERQTPLCARVFDRLVETGDVSGDSELETHLGSCMACYRTLTDLRDAPRLAALMRGSASAAGERRDSKFWQDAADRTTDAVAEALRAASPAGRARRTWTRAVAATGLLAAAAVLAVVVGRGRSLTPAGVPAPAVVAEAPGLPPDDDVAEGEDVADLDATTLRRLVDRLRMGAAGELAELTTSEPGEGLDTVTDDDAWVSDELAELDQAALVRIERSLAGSAL